MDALARLAPALADRYRVERELGQGGMATVFLADDLRHGRRVAIKLLHADLSAVLGPERFLAEIKTTAALQHPHILPLFDSGSADGLLYYVMPYVEGETLRGRLERERQLPVADAVRIAGEVADALQYAHDHGIVHRDVKPENILLQGGHALVADFGIALAVAQAAGQRLTQTGLSLGTPQYMAPEQATGDRHVDARADVYALGAVAYEMLAGEPPFTGPTAQAIVAKVLTDRPRPLRELRPTVPPHVAAAIHHALEKLPADRPAGAAEFARLLTREGAATRVAPAGALPSRGRGVIWGVAAAALALGVAGGYAAGRRAQADSAPVLPPTRLALLSPDLGGTGIAGQHRQLALAADGESVALVVLNAHARNALAIQRLDAAEATLVPAGDGLMNPQLSPDGRWLMAWGYPSQAGGPRERTFRISLAGGSATELPGSIDPRFAAWSSDGSFWYSAPGPGALQRLSPEGQVASVFPERTTGHRLQQILEPGPYALMVQSRMGSSAGAVVLFDLERREGTTVLAGPAVEARYAAGHLVYVQQDGVLLAVPFDLAARRATGGPVQLATGVSLTGTGVAQLAVVPNGTVAYIPEEPRSLVFAGRDGAFRLATPERRNYHAPEFSPDGRRISVDFTGPSGRDVWVLSLAQGTLSRVTFSGDGHDAVWTPDGQWLLYSSFRTGVLGLYRVRPGGAAPAESLLATATVGYTGRWLRDGSLLTSGIELRPNSGGDIVRIRNGGRGPVEPVIANPFQTSYPMPSPDGRRFAFVSDQSGQQEVYVRPLDEGGAELQMSQGGGTEPVWAPDGRALFYRGNVEGRLTLMMAELGTGGEPELRSRRALFPLDDIAGSSPHANYAVSPDGRTFVMVRRAPGNRVVVLQNLPELVRRLWEAGPTGR